MSIREHGRRYHSQPATVVYSSKDLDGIKPPFLKFGDESALKQFRLTFIKYCQKHANAIRRRPYAHRVRPRSVVECIDPDLLMYVCNHELSRKYRTKRPERVSARAVHDWVAVVPTAEIRAATAAAVVTAEIKSNNRIPIKRVSKLV